MAGFALPDLPSSWLVVLDALTRGPSAWTSPGDLARRLGQDESALTDLLADLDVAGWITVWERDEGPAVILSPWAADQLGVRLEELGAGLVYRWVDASDPEPAVFRARGVARSDALEDLDLVFDPQPTPLEALDALDSALQALPETASLRDLDPSRVPLPILLIGEGLIPWPGPSPDAPQCPGCRGRSLDPHEYCLRCDRWGLDHPLGLPSSRSAPTRPAVRAPRNPSWTPSTPSRSPQSQGGRSPDALRAARKARRKSRFQTRPDSPRSEPRPHSEIQTQDPISSGPRRTTSNPGLPIAGPSPSR